MINDQNPALQQCIDDFGRRHYLESAQHALSLLSSTPTLEAVQLLLISCQRLKKTRQLLTSDIVPKVFNLGITLAFETFKNAPWENALLKLTLGHMKPAEVLALARDNRQLCQVHYYAGSRMLTLGQEEWAVSLFNACLQTQAQCMEYQLAELDLKNRAKKPRWKFWIRRADTREEQPDFAGKPIDLAELYRDISNYVAEEPLVALTRETVMKLYEEVDQLYEQGRYQEAIPLAEQLRDMVRQMKEGEDNPDFSRVLGIQARLYASINDYTKAESFFQQACDIIRRVKGEEDPEYAINLSNLADFYNFAIGNHAAAEPLYHKALEIDRKLLGEEDPEVASVLRRLARLYTSMDKEVEAESLYHQAQEILLKTSDENHPEYVKTVENLVELYMKQSLQFMEEGRYQEAIDVGAQACDLLRQQVGESHPDFADILSKQGGLYEIMGNYELAETLYRQALGIQRSAFGEVHPQVASSLNHLAGLYHLLGKYAATEPLYRQAMEIQRTTVGEDHLDYANSLQHLAALYDHWGNHTASEPLHKQVEEIQRKAPGEENLPFPVGLFDQAALHYQKGEYREAELLMLQAVELTRTSVGGNRLVYAIALDNLATHTIHSDLSAEALLRQALEVVRRSRGENDSSFATSLHNLAELYVNQGKYKAAEPLYRQAVEILRTTLGERHPHFGTNLRNLAKLCVATGREDEAMALTQQATAVEDGLIGQVFSVASESQRMIYLQTFQAGFDIFLSLVLQHLAHSPYAVRAGLELVLRRKGIGAEALAAQRDAVLGGKYPALESKLRELTSVRMQIAQATLAGPGSEGHEAHQQQLVEWNARKERLEAELAGQIPEMNLEQQLQTVDRRTVALALPEGAALVEFVRFDLFDFKAISARDELAWKAAHYLAFVLAAGELDDVQMIDLGETESIDRFIASYRASITGEAERNNARHLLPTPIRQSHLVDMDDGTSLRAALFDPLLTALGTRKRLLLAPDGDLTRLPFEVLPMDDSRYLIDEYEISYLGTGRDILRIGAVSSDQPTNSLSLVVADPNFDLSGDEQAAEVAGPPGRQSRELDRGKLHFDHLPGTRVEGEQIGRMLGVQPLLEGAALEGRIKDCRSPRILHLATHGFFLENQKSDPNKERSTLEPIGLDGSEDVMERLSGLENPLLRSGVALAGANTWLRNGSLPADAEDGLLTAEDVSGLDLLDTELVVLSACETGLGEVRTGEGIFGLRRAFVLAGAKTLVMSLWKVPDKQTQELMEIFYRHILEGQPATDALRKAQLHMKGKYPDPLYWGAFICQGDFRPLIHGRIITTQQYPRR